MDIAIISVVIGTIAVSVLLLWTNFFWMRHTQTLVNKVMSHNYRDYAGGVKLEAEPPRKPYQKEIVAEDLGPLGEFKFN